MTTTVQIPPVNALKSQAKALRATLARDGQEMSHAKALEHLAHQYGYHDWNTLHAAAGNRPAPLALGGRVSGRYLGHRFDGEIMSLTQLGGGTYHGITVKFDAPIDVVAFEGMSAFRSRVNAVIDAEGRTHEKTSDGVPHLVLDI